MKHHTKINGYLIIAYGITYKTLIRAKPLHVRFEKVDRSIRNYGQTWQLVLSGPEKYDAF